MKVIWDFVKLWTLLYWSCLRLTVAKLVKFAVEGSLRGASNNLKVIVPTALSHVCRNSRWSLESATKRLHDNVGEVDRSWRSSWSEVRKRQQSQEALCRRLNCIIHWTPVWESSEVNERLIAGLPSFPPFIACRTVPALVLLCRLSFLFYIIPICVHLFNSTTRQSTIATELVFVD